MAIIFVILGAAPFVLGYYIPIWTAAGKLNMSDQMMSPVSGIVMNVKTISNCYNELTEEEANRLVEEIRIRGGKVTALLNQLIADSEKIM